MTFLEKATKSLSTSIEQFFSSTLKKITSGEELVTRHQIIGAIGLCVLIFGILVQTTIFPSMLESSLQEQVALTEGSFRRQMWNIFPFACELHVYVFNVTNPNGIDKGEKPILEEIGPFVYDVWHKKTNLMDDDENDTVSYSVNNTYVFNAQKSNNLSDDTELTLSSFLVFGTAVAAMKDHAALISIASKAVDSVGRDPSSLFVKQKVKTFLFDGQNLDCEGVTEFSGKILCNSARDDYWKYRMGKRAENLYYYSMFGGLNETDLYHGKNRIRRGSKDLKEVGQVVEFNNLKNMSTWKNDECDRFRGTEGTMFGPFFKKKKNKPLYVTSTFYCRTFAYKYESTVEYQGLKLLRYTTSVGTEMETNEKDKCYCIKPNRCLRNGVYDIFRCILNAYVVSNPHFYLADPSYVNGVEGVRPNKDEHMIILDIEPLTGLAVRTHFRVQYNFELMNLKKYRLMKDVRDAMFPLVWTDEVMILPDFIIRKIKSTHTKIMIAKVISYLMILVGLATCGYAAFCEYKLRKA